MRKVNHCILDGDSLLRYYEEEVNHLRKPKGGEKMTDMKRMTISMPDEIDRKIMEMKKDDQYARYSYSEIVQVLVRMGLEKTGK